jgi:hypothetical protein
MYSNLRICIYSPSELTLRRASCYRTTLFTTFSVSMINIGVREEKIVGRTIVWSILKEIFQGICPNDGGRQNFQDLIWRLRITKYKKGFTRLLKYSLAVMRIKKIILCGLLYAFLSSFARFLSRTARILNRICPTKKYWGGGATPSATPMRIN